MAPFIHAATPFPVCHGHEGTGRIFTIEGVVILGISQIDTNRKLRCTIPGTACYGSV